MLSKLKLTNFRCFDDHIVELQHKTLLVGRNNAGKSTCVEALRLVSLVTERIGSLALRNPPPWADLPLRCSGVSPSLESIELHKTSLFHNYSEAPAVISAVFENGSRIDVHIGPEAQLHAVIYDQNGRPAKNRAAINSIQVPRVSILPQIAPLQERELVRDSDYVRKNIQTSRSSLHFRNQLLLSREHFEEYRRAVAVTWPGLELQPLVVPPVLERDEKPLGLIVRDGEFSAEVAWMGHGLQMWLQTIWFLTRNVKSSVLILDEPDVYMHADLQRKLVRMLLRDQRQFIIATHSPEMLSEVEPDSVVVLDRRRQRSRSATSSNAVQQLLTHVGSVHNLSLARLASQQRLLLVEGQDMGLLKRFQNAAFPDSEFPLDAIPNSSIDGWSGWPAVLILARFLRENTDGSIRIHCVLDRDYHSDDEVSKRVEQADNFSIHLHIWRAKELENYVLVPTAIARVISKKIGSSVPVERVEEALRNAAELRKDETFDAFSEAVRTHEKKGADQSNRAARPQFNKRWNELGGSMVVCGKQLFADMAKWVQAEYSVTISTAAIAHEMRSDEVADEVRTFIAAVTGT